MCCAPVFVLVCVGPWPFIFSPDSFSFSRSCLVCVPSLLFRLLYFRLLRLLCFLRCAFPSSLGLPAFFAPSLSVLPPFVRCPPCLPFCASPSSPVPLLSTPFWVFCSGSFVLGLLFWVFCSAFLRVSTFSSPGCPYSCRGGFPPLLCLPSALFRPLFLLLLFFLAFWAVLVVPVLFRPLSLFTLFPPYFSRRCSPLGVFCPSLLPPSFSSPAGVFCPPVFCPPSRCSFLPLLRPLPSFFFPFPSFACVFLPAFVVPAFVLSPASCPTVVPAFVVSPPSLSPPFACPVAFSDCGCCSACSAGRSGFFVRFLFLLEGGGSFIVYLSSSFSPLPIFS